MGISGSSHPNEVEGFQVSMVTPHSPAHQAGLVPFFDFIVKMDNFSFVGENTRFFREYLQSHKGQVVQLTVYNSKLRDTRDVPLTPNDDWGGQGLLGCSIEWNGAERSMENTWHITGVVPNSPAMQAGLLAGRQWVIGMQDLNTTHTRITMFADSGDFHARLEQKMIQRVYAKKGEDAKQDRLLVLVYDSVDNAVKEMVLHLEGADSVGIEAANGYLHAIPTTTGDMRVPVMMQFVVEPYRPPQHTSAAPSLPTAPYPVYQPPLHHPSEPPPVQEPTRHAHQPGHVPSHPVTHPPPHPLPREPHKHSENSDGASDSSPTVSEAPPSQRYHAAPPAPPQRYHVDQPAQHTVPDQPAAAQPHLADQTHTSPKPEGHAEPSYHSTDAHHYTHHQQQQQQQQPPVPVPDHHHHHHHQHPPTVSEANAQPPAVGQRYQPQQQQHHQEHGQPHMRYQAQTSPITFTEQQLPS